jgi:hypothetical protein
MEIFLIGVLLLAFPIIAIVALVKTINLGERLRVIEQRFEALELRPAGEITKRTTQTSRQYKEHHNGSVHGNQ